MAYETAAASTTDDAGPSTAGVPLPVDGGLRSGDATLPTGDAALLRSGDDAPLLVEDRRRARPLRPMAAPAVGAGTLRRLSELRTDGRPVLSVYLDLHGAAPGARAAREGEIEALMNGSAGRAGRANLERVRHLLTVMPSLAHGTRSLALFSSAGGTVFEAVPLPCEVETAAVVDTMPWLEPLMRMCLPGPWSAAAIESGGGMCLPGPRSAASIGSGGGTSRLEPCSAAAIGSGGGGLGRWEMP